MKEILSEWCLHVAYLQIENETDQTKLKNTSSYDIVITIYKDLYSLWQQQHTCLKALLIQYIVPFITYPRVLDTFIINIDTFQ